MKHIIHHIIDKTASYFRKTHMKTQLTVMYFAAVFTPVLILSIILVSVSVRNLRGYQQDLIRSNNENAKSILYEITSQVYKISDEIAYNETVMDVLSEQYPAKMAFSNAVDELSTFLNYYRKNYSGIQEIRIYTNQQGANDSGNIYAVNDAVETEPWYHTAVSRYSVTWRAVLTRDEYGNDYWNLVLTRQIPLHDTEAKAVLYIQLDENYLKSRIEETNYYTVLSMEDNCVVYSTNRSDCGKTDVVPVGQGDRYYSYSGNLVYRGYTYLSSVTTLNMIQSESYMYITTISLTANSSITQNSWIMVLMILLALLLPALIMTVFTRSINRQVTTLRNEMYKASQEYYELSGFDGCYELTAAYNDLRTMIEKIQNKDARMYKNQIVEQKLLNEQQKMEFKMLASQINPHFLYNTLEMIRMKAVTAGDKETASAIKLLGKSMRYVLDNTGTSFTTLAKEMNHIDIYLQIQRLRFGDRVNYHLTVDDGIDMDKVQVLPLLLQPIVENAILHGLEEVESGGRIDVHIYKETFQTLCIEITDNGCGMDEETLENMRANLEKGHINKRYGIGLYNINQRLRINYGPMYGLTIDSKLGTGTKVSCRLKAEMIV